MLSFREGVSRAVRRSFRPGGRATRSEYWWFQLLFFGLIAAAYVVDEALGTPIVWDGSGVALLLVMVATLPTQVTLTLRRFQDRGVNGVWGLPYALSDIIPTDRTVELIDVVGPGMVVVIGALAILYILWGFLQTVLPSDPHANAYGPGPEGSAESVAETFS